jgi:ATP-dependent Clp protease ATP-binding subunit ClpC
VSGEVLERHPFTERARLAILFARRAARERGAPNVGGEHLVYGLVREEEGTAAQILVGHGLTADVAVAALPPKLEGDPMSEGMSLTFEPSADRALERAAHEARWDGREYAATEHVLLGLVHEAQGLALRLLLDTGINEDAVRADLARLRR